MSAEMIEKTVHDYFAAISALDAEAWVATFAEDGVSHDPVGTPPLVGKEALRQFFNAIAGGFEQMHMAADQMFIVGQSAAVKWSARGTGKNGRAVTFAGIDIFEINEAGKVQNICAYWNPAAMMAELQG